MDDETIERPRPVLGSQTRRGALKCMAWAGTGILWTVSGGIPRTLGPVGGAMGATADSFCFVQISDTHIGFDKPANPDVAGTAREGIAKIKSLPVKPALLIHTGDVSQLSKPAQFDLAEQIVKESGLDAHYIPGEHDMLDDDGKPFFARFSKGAPNGWYSFDQGGVHFVALINVANFKPGGMGSLGPDQLDWMGKDLAARSSSTPIVVFAHMPLWPLYPEWGWGTEDSPALMAHLRRFGSVTVLNGHIHQIAQKVEGNLRFHTARSLAFPQPPAGVGPGPKPMPVPPGQLHSVLGITSVEAVPGAGPLALTDIALSA